MKEKFTFFYGGPFSQWHKSTFFIDGIAYSHAEQYMMAEKARLFGDIESLNKIMSSKDPKEQKSLGKNVKPYDDNKWNSVAKQVVYKGNMAKFTQNENLKKILLDTEGTTLVEASPVDRKYGVGLAENDPLIQDRKNWRGTNWLGEVLTQVREDIIKMEKK